jgi:hypothetical protein
MIVAAVLTSVLALLFGLSLNLQESLAGQEAKMSTQDNLRGAMQYIARELRQSSSGSIAWASLPATTVSYRKADDVDGNGTAVDSGGFLELTPVRTIQRDITDLNGDGVTATQVIMVEGTTVRVIANNVPVSEDVDGDLTLDAGEDSNFNNALDRGLWFEQDGRGIRVTLQTQLVPTPRSSATMSALTEIVVPRN